MKIYHLVIFSLLILTEISCQSQANPASNTIREVGGPCECCEAWKDGMPPSIDWKSQISPENEPGQALEISGTILNQDGKTPAEGVVLYVYHTDANGEYSRGSDISTCAKRHGLLRGWVKTGKDGRYLFKTIRPASYPNTNIEQHIHPIIIEPGLSEYWIDEFVFEDDPKLSEATRNRINPRGGSGVIELTKNSDGVWLGERDIILGKNVSGY